MPITDEQVAVLRAHLSGDFDEYQRLWEQLDRDAAQVGYSSLIAAAFFKAVDRHFDKQHTSMNDVVQFVADVRSRFDTTGESVNAMAAETMIRTVLGSEPEGEFDDATVAAAQVAVLTALIIDDGPTAKELDAFLEEARKLGDQWID